MSGYIDTVELDRLIRRKKRLYGCKLIRVEVRPDGLMEFVYHCSDARKWANKWLGELVRYIEVVGDG